MCLRTQLQRFTAILVAVLVASGCAHSAKKDSPAQVIENQERQAPESEAKLAESVRRKLRAAGRRTEGPSSKIVFKKPYYYREYFIYPNGEEDFVLNFTERDSRTAPLTAEVNIAKNRYSTRTHLKREDARRDENFLRDTGRETISYELRNGAWYRLGSLYIADKTEENIEGEWQSVHERPELPMFEDEKPKGGWRRLLFWR